MKQKPGIEKYIALLKENGATEAVKIPRSSIITAPWTHFKCRYGCMLYNKCLCCPPNTPNWKETSEILDCYEYGILFCMKEELSVKPLAAKVCRELFLDGYYKAIAFGCGPCHLCPTCNMKHCVHATEAIPAMEACGIDVFGTVRGNGLEIDTIREESEPHHYYGLLMPE